MSPSSKTRRPSGNQPSDRRGGRPKAREIVLRALFESSLSGDSAEEVLELSLGKFRMTLAGRDYALRLVRNAVSTADEADAAIRRALRDWELERLGCVERALLRMAYAELRHHDDVEAKVVLDEAIRLARRYGTDESGAFVNGVLDHLARKLRPSELETLADEP